MPQVQPPAVEPLKTSPSVPRLKVMVESVLSQNPKYRGVEARNSDIALTICLWQQYYSVGSNPDSTIHLYRLFDLPSEAVIGRARRVIQNTEHKYLPNDPRVLIARSILEEYWEEALGYRLTKEEWQRHHKTEAELKRNEQRAML